MKKHLAESTIARIIAAHLEGKPYRIGKFLYRLEDGIVTRQRIYGEQNYPVEQRDDARKWHTFSKLDDYIVYDFLPEDVKRWSHATGSLLYNNAMWEDGTQWEQVTSGGDHTAVEFLMAALKSAKPDWILDPLPGTLTTPTFPEYFIVKRSEWESAEGLDPNYKDNRRYWRYQ